MTHPTVAKARDTFRSTLRTPFAAIFIAYVVLRLVGVVGLGVLRAPDSQSWLTLDFSGSEIRLWTIPLFFKILPADSLRLAGQLVLSIACWSALAGVTASLVRKRFLQPIAFALILALSLVPQVTQWDTILLGESVAISLSVALIAGWLAFVQQPDVKRVVIVCVVTVPWAFTRHPLIAVSALIAVLVAISLARREGRRLRAVALAVLVLVVAIGWPMLSKNRFDEEETLATIVSERILTSPERTEWFADHGMPDGPAVRKLAGSYYEQGHGSTLIRANKRLFRWIQDDGRSAYLEYLLTHPAYTLGLPLQDAVAPAGSTLAGDLDYSEARPVLPDPVRELLYGSDGGQLVLLGVVALTLAGVAIARAGFRRIDLVTFGTLVLGGVLYVLSYHGAGSEPLRHNLLAAIVLRVALLLIGLLSLDRVLTARDDRDSPVPAPVPGQ